MIVKKLGIQLLIQGENYVSLSCSHVVLINHHIVPLHPNVSIYFLQTLFFTLQTRSIHQTKLLRLVIISFILMILTNDSSGLLWGELGCLSPLVYKGFKMQNKDLSLIIDYFLSCKLIS